ncbi:MAG: hypothetical protein R3314_04185 [Longimicrobiales bacterium]|nr:hypothetical protein [Longimicrobiales bacterium]
MTDPKTRADARLETALEDADQQDPRPHLREALRALKDRDPDGFREALRHFEEELTPAVAGEADPLDAWAEYGMMLARTIGAGRTVELDSTGRSRPVEDVRNATGLVLHVPDDASTPAIVLRYPREASPAQRASYELLVEGRQTASLYQG